MTRPDTLDLGRTESAGLAIEHHSIDYIPEHERHAKLAGELPLIHRDPFDRMLVAQARIEQLAIVTADADIPRYGIPVIW